MKRQTTIGDCRTPKVAHSERATLLSAGTDLWEHEVGLDHGDMEADASLQQVLQAHGPVVHMPGQGVLVVQEVHLQPFCSFRF